MEKTWAELYGGMTPDEDVLTDEEKDELIPKAKEEQQQEDVKE